MDESKKFAEWLARLPEPSILPNQWSAVQDVMDRMPNADLLSCMFHGPASVSQIAFEMLRDRFEEERYWLKELDEDYRN